MKVKEKLSRWRKRVNDSEEGKCRKVGDEYSKISDMRKRVFVKSQMMYNEYNNKGIFKRCLQTSD